MNKFSSFLRNVSFVWAETYGMVSNAPLSSYILVEVPSNIILKKVKPDVRPLLMVSAKMSHIHHAALDSFLGTRMGHHDDVDWRGSCFIQEQSSLVSHFTIRSIISEVLLLYAWL